jgi:hypothetical protein
VGKGEKKQAPCGETPAARRIEPMPNQPPEEHNYRIKLAKMVEAGTVPSAGGVHEISVYHDAWCGIYRGVRCNCDPIIEVLPPAPVG